MTNMIDNLTEQLVGRIQRAFIAGRRDIALKLARDAIQGNSVTDDQFEESLALPSKQDTLDSIWALGGEIFDGQPARWRSLVGKLIKVCGKMRALEVMIDCSHAHTEDATSYIGASLARGERSPLWRLTEEELCDACAEFEIKTQGEGRKDLEAKLTAARKRATDRTCHGFGEEIANG